MTHRSSRILIVIKVQVAILSPGWQTCMWNFQHCTISECFGENVPLTRPRFVCRSLLIICLERRDPLQFGRLTDCKGSLLLAAFSINYHLQYKNSSRRSGYEAQAPVIAHATHTHPLQQLCFRPAVHATSSHERIQLQGAKHKNTQKFRVMSPPSPREKTRDKTTWEKFSGKTPEKKIA